MTASTQPRPGLRRTLEAFGKLAAELKTGNRDARPEREWRTALIDSQRRVIEHYRHVLARRRMPPAERAALLERITRVEDEIRVLQDEERPAEYSVAA
jgi:hypothetical protein